MVAIESFADSDFQDMQRPLDPQAARIVQLPLARVDAWAELTLSDLAEKGVDFPAPRLRAARSRRSKVADLSPEPRSRWARILTSRLDREGTRLDLRH